MRAVLYCILEYTIQYTVFSKTEQKVGALLLAAATLLLLRLCCRCTAFFIFLANARVLIVSFLSNAAAIAV